MFSTPINIICPGNTYICLFLTLVLTDLTDWSSPSGLMSQEIFLQVRKYFYNFRKTSEMWWTLCWRNHAWHHQSTLFPILVIRTRSPQGKLRNLLSQESCTDVAVVTPAVNAEKLGEKTSHASWTRPDATYSYTRLWITPFRMNGTLLYCSTSQKRVSRHIGMRLEKAAHVVVW